MSVPINGSLVVDLRNSDHNRMLLSQYLPLPQGIGKPIDGCNLPLRLFHARFCIFHFLLFLSKSLRFLCSLSVGISLHEGWQNGRLVRISLRLEICILLFDTSKFGYFARSNGFRYCNTQLDTKYLTFCIITPTQVLRRLLT